MAGICPLSQLCRQTNEHIHTKKVGKCSFVMCVICTSKVDWVLMIIWRVVSTRIERKNCYKYPKPRCRWTPRNSLKGFSSGFGIWEWCTSFQTIIIKPKAALKFIFRLQYIFWIFWFSVSTTFTSRNLTETGKTFDYFRKIQEIKCLQTQLSSPEQS